MQTSFSLCKSYLLEGFPLYYEKKYFNSALFVPGHVSHWYRSWYLGLISQIHLRPPSSQTSLRPQTSLRHPACKLWVYMMITVPWSPSLDLILTSVHSLTLDLPFSHGLTQWSGPLGDPDRLSQVSPACLWEVRLNLSYQGLCPALIPCLGHHLLESSWVFLLPSLTVWQTVCCAAV